jgi:hypothetical protein
VQSVRPEVFDAMEAVFRGGNLVRRARTLESLLSALDPPPTALQWINPLQLSRLSYQELEPPSSYTISVRYPDGRVLSESYQMRGERAREIVLSVDEARALLQECLAAIMREIGGVRMI